MLLKISGDFPGTPGLTHCLPMQEVGVRSMVRELRSHMTLDQKKQNIKQMQYCNKFNKDLKMAYIKKKRKQLKMCVWVQ